MELIWPESAAWTALKSALTPALAGVWTRLQAPPTRLTAGDAGGPALTLTAQGIALHPDLLGPDVYATPDRSWMAQAPKDLVPLALDRWRRAAGLILEGLLLRQLARTLDCAPEDLPRRWWTIGWAAEQVDRLDPELGWIWPDAADLLYHPQQSLAAHPRRAAWLFRWFHQTDRPLPISVPEPAPTIAAADWAAFGAWCRDPTHGPAAAAPLPRTHAPPASTPLRHTAPAMSHHPVLVVAGPAGLRIDSPQLAAPATVLGNRRALVVLGVQEEGPLHLHTQPAQLVGKWKMASGEYNGRVGAARGVELRLSRDGQVDIILANAFVGTLRGEALKLAQKFGASGFGGGQWVVTDLEPEYGRGELTFNELTVDHLTIHPRRGLKFALPGQIWIDRIRSALGRVNNRPMRFSLDANNELTLSCKIRDADLILRLIPSDE
ncbi:MAG: hypothetical protein AAFV53_03685 [Myxococcota bacterium]